VLQNKTIHLKRLVYPMPAYVREKLTNSALMEVYEQRPPYQQNDYVAWISRAKLPVTREERLSQMLHELRAGDLYMGMRYHPRHAKAVTAFLTQGDINVLAAPANIRLGEEIVKDGGVAFVEQEHSLVVATVQPKGGLRRTVELWSTDSGLAWKCTCTSRKLFCKHCVAAAIATRRHAPDGQ
jgi:uncharacterized Zn finger protein